MKKLSLILAIVVSLFAVQAQTITRDAQGNYHAVRKDSTKAVAQATGKTYTDAKGKTYPVYAGGRGGMYILMTSRTTGKEYKKYLKVN